ncbi:MAG TPA: hypothetical protein PKK26_06085, partial [Candidatus Wallbacteria bacterium]|nr:hypothetical protein [Candidatus Wallbacteria bacterium]
SGIETVEIRPQSAATLFDAAGNSANPAQTTGQKSLNDVSRPTVSSMTYSINPKVYKQGTPVTITANFSTAASATPKISITGANAVNEANMTFVSGTQYKYAYAIGPGEGYAAISINATAVSPASPFNPSPVSGGFFTVDNTPPSFTVSGNQVNASGDVIKVIFDDDMTAETAITTKTNWAFYHADNNAGLNLTQITITNATLSYSAPERTLTVTLNEATDNAFIPPGKYLRAVSNATNIKDIAGNPAGALSVYSAVATPTEIVLPTFTVSATSRDALGDQIVLTFSDAMYASSLTTKTNWTIHLADDQSGTNLFPVIIANAGLNYNSSTKKLTITLNEAYDKSFIPNNKYVRVIPNPANIKDLAGNAIGTFSAYSAAVPMETIAPSISSVTAASVHNGRDIIYIYFSDYMDTTPNVLTNKSNWEVKYADDAAGTNAFTFPLTNASIGYACDNNNKYVSITLNEVTDKAFIPPSKFVIATLLNVGPMDLVGNPLPLSQKATTTAVAAETTKPAVSSISAVSNNAGNDVITIYLNDYISDTTWPLITDHTNWLIQYADDAAGTNAAPFTTTNATFVYSQNSNPRSVTVTLNEITDNAFIPPSKFVIVTPLSTSVTDFVGNSMSLTGKATTTVVATDAISPTISSITATSVQNGNDLIYITFSEYMDPAAPLFDKATWNLEYADNSSGSNLTSINLTNAVFSYSQSAKKITVTLDESIDKAFIPSSKFIKATVIKPANVNDLVGNQNTTINKYTSAAVSTIRPFISSITFGDGNGQINNGDSIVITFAGDEINPATINAGLIKGGSVSISAAGTGQVTWPAASKTITVSGICSFPITKATNFVYARSNISSTTLALDPTGKILTITLDNGVTSETVLANTTAQNITAITTTVKDFIGGVLTTTTNKIAIGQKF